MSVIKRFLKWYLLVAVLAGAGFGIYSWATTTDEQRAARNAVATAEEAKGKFQSDLKSAIEGQKGDIIVALHTNAKDEAQKKQVVEQTNAGYMKWLSSLHEKERFNHGLNKELVGYYNTLEFVEKVSDPGLSDLLSIRKSLGGMMSNQDDWDQKAKAYSPTAQHVEHPEKARLIDAYIASRVGSAFNLSIAGIKLTENYTDQYLIKSYRSVLNTPVATNDWEAVVIFKKNTPVQQGTMRFNAVQVGENKYVKSGGFEANLPVYVEINNEDIEYSYKLRAYRLYRKNHLDSITKTIEKYGLTKSETKK